LSSPWRSRRPPARSRRVVRGPVRYRTAHLREQRGRDAAATVNQQEVSNSPAQAPTARPAFRPADGPPDRADMDRDSANLVAGRVPGVQFQHLRSRRRFSSAASARALGHAVVDREPGARMPTNPGQKVQPPSSHPRSTGRCPTPLPRQTPSWNPRAAAGRATGADHDHGYVRHVLRQVWV
jgi:hypothetical protein